jgi:O-antigen/teichoic acid export membrane protein
MGGISSMILPLIITTLINSEATAHFYMAFTIANLLFIIPSAVTTSLFAEGSAKEEIKEEIKKSIKFISIFIILGIILILLFGRYFLLLFGKTYSSEGYILLNILALSGIFISINSIFSIILKIKKQMKKLIIINSISAIITVGLSIIFIKFIPTLGIKGVGISWLIGQAIVSLIYLMFFKGITQERIN